MNCSHPLMKTAEIKIPSSINFFLIFVSFTVALLQFLDNQYCNLGLIIVAFYTCLICLCSRIIPELNLVLPLCPSCPKASSRTFYLSHEAIKFIFFQVLQRLNPAAYTFPIPCNQSATILSDNS